VTSTTVNRILIGLLIVVGTVWIFLPIVMATLWSLVDPSEPWAYPDAFPRKLSFVRWADLWNTTQLPTAMRNSYLLAPMAGAATLVFASPTAYAFGRRQFRGKAVAQVAALLPIVLPGFVIAIFFSSILIQLNIFNRYLSILLGHTILFLPYAIRILTVSFAQVPQDLIDAARDLNANALVRFRSIYLPLMIPGYVASFIIIVILSIEEFAVAFVVGAPDFTTIPTILYSNLSGYSFVRPNAAVISLILVIPNIIALVFLERLLGSVEVGSGTKG